MDKTVWNLGEQIHIYESLKSKNAGQVKIIIIQDRFKPKPTIVQRLILANFDLKYVSSTRYISLFVEKMKITFPDIT